MEKLNAERIGGMSKWRFSCCWHGKGLSKQNTKGRDQREIKHLKIGDIKIKTAAHQKETHKTHSLNMQNHLQKGEEKNTNTRIEK